MRPLNDPSLLRNQAYIDGKFTGTAEVPVTNPATGDTLALVPNFGAVEATAAVDAAARAFRPWADRTAKDRSALLRKWFDLILANRQDLATILTSEQGKP